MFDPVTPTRSYEHIAAQIEAQIRSGELTVGQQIPGERELANLFRVSRVVVREAMRNLEARGIIEVRHGRGAFIQMVPPRMMAQTLTLLLQLEKAPYLDLMEVRLTLERSAAGLAAVNASERDISGIHRWLEEMERLGGRGLRGIGDYRRWSELNAELHSAIGLAARNAPLQTLLQAILQMSMQGRLEIVGSLGDVAIYFDRQGVSRVHQEHRAIVEAIARHDRTAAERLAEVHLSNSIDLFRSIEQLYRESPKVDGLAPSPPRSPASSETRER